ncbi:MAG: flippase-like domain-containing protein [Aeriscardovia sp.]|nr:flippase-like domain-containing protein [Aeriscardovia sp.]
MVGKKKAAKAQAAPDLNGAKIIDRTPKRMRDWRDLAKLALFLVLSALVVISSLWLKNTTNSIESDVRRVSYPFSWLVLLPLSLLFNIVLSAIVIAVFIQLLLKKMWIPALTCALALISGFCISVICAHLFFIYRLDSFLGAGSSFRAGAFDASLTVMAFLTASNGRSMRNKLAWAWKVYYCALAIVVIASLSTVPASLMAIFSGAWIGLAFRLAFGTPSSGAWGSQLAMALGACGMEVERLERIEPSTAQKICCDGAKRSRYYSLCSGGKNYLMVVNDEQQHSLRYLKQIWDAIKMEGLTIRHDRSVEAMAERHYAILLDLKDMSAPAPRPARVGAVSDSAFMVFDIPSIPFSPIASSSISEADVKSLISYLNSLHKKGLTHRNISPSSLARNGQGDPFLVGWSGGDVISGAAHKKIDMIQLLAVLSDFTGVKKTMEIAKEVLGAGELATLFPYAQTIVIPKSTRREKGWRKKVLKPLKSSLEGAARDEDKMLQTVRLARFNIRRFITVLLVTIALIVVFTQLNFKQVIKAIEGANPWWSLAACAIGLVAWTGSATAFGIFIDKSKRKRHHLGILGTQAVASFAAVSMPAIAGPIAVNITFLRKIGYSNTEATAIASADTVTEFSTTILMFIVLGFFTGQNVFHNLIPNKMIIIVTVGVLVGLVALAMAIKPVRNWIRKKCFPVLKTYGSMLGKLFSHPLTLLISMAGSIVQNTALDMAFWFSLLAFGYHLNFIETLFLFLFANGVGSAVPTPGGLGAIETVLSTTFIGIGVPGAIAVSATLLFRLATYWLRMALGALYMKYMEKKHLL